jgi:hypothetical protein
LQRESVARNTKKKEKKVYIMRIQELSNEINGMMEQLKAKSEVLFKELFEEKLDKWLVKDGNGTIIGYEVDDTSEDDQDFLALQRATNEVIEMLKWELLDWRIFPYEEEDILLERGSLRVNIKNGLLNIDITLVNLFKIK